MTKVIGLGFPGSLQDEAVICYICKKYNVNVRIIEASFSMSSGWAILEIDGTDDEVKKVFDYFTTKGIKIQQIETKQ